MWLVPQTINISRRTFVRDCATIAAATGLPLWFVQRELEALHAGSCRHLPPTIDRALR